MTSTSNTESCRELAFSFIRKREILPLQPEHAIRRWIRKAAALSSIRAIKNFAFFSPPSIGQKRVDSFRLKSPVDYDLDDSRARGRNFACRVYFDLLSHSDARLRLP